MQRKEKEADLGVHGNVEASAAKLKQKAAKQSNTVKTARRVAQEANKNKVKTEKETKRAIAVIEARREKELLVLEVERGNWQWSGG